MSGGGGDGGGDGVVARDGGGGGGDGGGGADGTICADVNVDVSGVIPTVLLLIDQSGSMDDSFPGSSSRWNAVYSTLMDGSTGAVKQLDASVRFGLALYTSHNGNSGGVCPVVTSVPPALSNFAAIDAVYAPAQPDDDTPTGESIAQVTPGLVAITDPGPKIIVLATDGLPDTCADPNGDGKALSIQATEDAFTQGIETFVISVGPDVAQQHLQDLANAGVGNPVGGAVNAPYYQALNSGDLVAAFDTIIGGVRTCDFTLNGMVDGDGSGGRVYVDGVEIPPGDWVLVDPTHIRLVGGTCDDVLAGGSHTISATFPCGSVIIG